MKVAPDVSSVYNLRFWLLQKKLDQYFINRFYYIVRLENKIKKTKRVLLDRRIPNPTQPIMTSPTKFNLF